MANPPPAPLENLYFYQLLSHLLPKVLVADGIRPAEPKDPYEADVNEDLDSFHGYSGGDM